MSRVSHCRISRTFSFTILVPVIQRIFNRMLLTLFLGPVQKITIKQKHTHTCTFSDVITRYAAQRRFFPLFILNFKRTWRKQNTPRTPLRGLFVVYWENLSCTWHNIECAHAPTGHGELWRQRRVWQIEETYTVHIHSTCTHYTHHIYVYNVHTYTVCNDRVTEKEEHNVILPPSHCTSPASPPPPSAT